MPLAGLAAAQRGVGFRGASAGGDSGRGWRATGAGVRTLISAPAGFASMPPLPFVRCPASGTALWTVALAFAGRVLGGQDARVSRVLEPAGLVVLALVVGMHVVRVARWKGRPAA